MDWESLTAAREKFADDLAEGGTPVLQVPVSDGVPIVERMNHVGLICQVPVQLVDVP